ncbi:MAG: M13 family metallopeptidase, partial [Muribaculaceae bacterium]|nr:M13 family metallopeptidase [Muribaculaceae bacterium]
MKMLKVMFSAAMLAGAMTLTAAEHLKCVNPAYIDNSIAPGEDFYLHVNNGWMKAHPLTPEYARFGVFNILNDSAEKHVQDIVLNLGATNPAKGTNAFKIWTLYSQGMDSVRRNNEGATPILADLKKIEETPHEGMEDLFLWMHRNYSSPFFAAGPQEDMANSQVYAMYVGGGSIGMGDRDYYLLNDKENKRLREAYQKLIVGQMQNAGYSKKDSSRIMKHVMKIETALADSTWTREESRNIPAMYNPRTIAQVKEMYPHINWDRFFVETMDIDTPDQVIVTEINTVKQADNLMSSLTDREIKDYYLWKYVSQAAPYLSDKFSDTAFEYSKARSGVEQQRPRWKRALAIPDSYMGEAIGQLYVEKHFPEKSKEMMLELVNNLKMALGKHIINLPWMSDDTKVRAMDKLSNFTVKIGYPDKWKDYSAMEIDPALSYYENVHNAGMWHQKEALAKWGKPVDRTEWGMTPQTVDAYYNPRAN